jgi:flagellar basal body-associated protein FliL
MDFQSHTEEMEYFLTHKWDKQKYVKLIITLMDSNSLVQQRLKGLSDKALRAIQASDIE